MQYDHAARAREILNDLIDYTGQPAELVRSRCQYSTSELSWQFREGKYEDNPLEFYRDTDLYVFDLTKYQSILVPHVSIMVEQAKKNKIKKVLDLGGGIGEYTLRFMKEAGCEVTYMDLRDSFTANYAQWRFKRHKIEPKVEAEDFNWHEQAWDAVIAMDVLEHMEYDVAMKALETMRSNVQYVFCNPEAIKYNELYPQHITRFTLQGFDHIDLNLYKNTALK